ncbi:MAG: class III poly(R)-hydroxyalkanoic acid synthase subunit PhaE [Lysobacter sp.]
MANQGFGMGGFSPEGFGDGSEDFAALARQYWSRWGEMLRGQAAPAPASGFGAAGFAGSGFPGFFGAGAGMPGAGLSGAGASGAAAGAMPGWNEAVAWWSQLAQGGSHPADAAVERFNNQARGWYAQMQQLAAQFAGQDASAADIAKAWKQGFGGAGGNPFAEALRGMQGPGQQGFEQWLGQVAPWLEQMQREGQSWLGTPALGFTREHQQRWQQLASTLQDYQQQDKAYQALLAEAMQDAFKRFEDKLAACSEPGKQLESARALFDLWIDAAEEAYAEVALSPRFRDAYGALVNAQMRLRSAVQREVEQAGEAMGVPTRTEVDAAHRKITQLERELRRLRDRLDGAESTPQSASNPRGGGQARATRAKAAASEPVAKVVTKAPSKDVSKAASKPASKQPAARNAAKSASVKRAVKKSVATKKVSAKKASATGKSSAPGSTKKPTSATRSAVAKPAAKAR